MNRILFFLFIFFSLHNQIYAQQWLDKKYDFNVTKNIVYGTATNFNGSIDTLKIDIYNPACDDILGVSKKPLLVWIHGGAFLSGNKNDPSIINLCEEFAKRGYITASISYRLGFVADKNAWNCNYPNYACIFAADEAEWQRAYYRAMQDAKGAIRFLVNRHNQYRIDLDNIFVGGESAGGFIALATALLDTLPEKPAVTYAIEDAPLPSANSLTCEYNVGKTFNGTTVPRPSLGSINGSIEPTTIPYSIKGVANLFGAMNADILKLHRANVPKPVIYSFHQPCDLIVPIDSGKILGGLSWCFANGYSCYTVSNTPTVYGSQYISTLNADNNYGYNIYDDFTNNYFPYNFWFGDYSCVAQTNYPCHGYDNKTLRENNLAEFFAQYITTNPICNNTFNGVENLNEQHEAIKIYPNPAEYMLTIEVDKNEEFGLEITDVMGKTYFNNRYATKINKLNISSLNNGIYFLKIIDRKGFTTNKKFEVIKEK